MATPAPGFDVKRKNVTFAQEENREIQKKSKPAPESKPVLESTKPAPESKLVPTEKEHALEQEAYLQEISKFFDNLYKSQYKELEDFGAKQEKILADFYSASTAKIDKKSTSVYALLEELFQQLEKNEQLRQELNELESGTQQFFHGVSGGQK